ncbi:MAG: ABC transporter permease [Candidatus Solibacter usitatus]|nr:ABC transporter permease [Candidatus Solibacter usitatus]
MLRYALRTLAKSPVFSLVAIFSLALGIGANTAIFTLVDQVLLRLLPVKNPQELVLLTWRGSHYCSNTGSNALSYPMYTDFRARNQVFSGLLCRHAAPLSMGYQGQTERIDGELVSGNYFEVLGVKPAIGRTFTSDDDRTPGGHPVIVLSHDFWLNRFSADPKVLGQTLAVNGHSLTVVGVAESGFYGVEIGFSPKMWIPVMMKKAMTPGWADLYNLENRRARWVNVFGRLKPGTTLTQAKASLQPIFHSVLDMEVKDKEFANATSYTKEQFLRSWIDVLPAAKGRSGLRRQAETPLWVLMAIVGLVLLIACANVANLLMARAAEREKEIAVRLALGAGRGRLIRQLMVESLLLALIGGASGLALSVWTDRLLLGLLPAGDAPLQLSAAPDPRILAFALAVSLLTGADLNITLKEQGGALAGGAHVRSRKALVAAQVFLSLLLLIGAGLFIRSLRNLRALDPGFRTQNVIAFSIDPVLNGYPKQRSSLLYRQLKERLEATPGVESAALAVVRILDGDEWDSTVSVEGYEPKPGEDMNPFYNSVSAGYFTTLGIPLAAGRDFRSSDEGSKQKVGIVNEKFARRYFGDRSPVGRHFGFGGNPGTKTDIEIVGVIRDAKYMNMREEIQRQVFVPHFQSDWVIAMTVYVRTRFDPAQMHTVLRRAVHELDPNLPVYQMRGMEVQLDRALIVERMIASLAAVFGLLATLLAAIGLYGVMAYNVARRTREIGIRMALGALSRNVTWLVMKEVLLLLAVGVALALPAAFVLTRLVRTQLYGITPNDPLTILAATLALAAVAVTAGYVPALRATRIDPIRALRYE